MVEISIQPKNNFCDLEDDKLRESFTKTGEYYVVR